MWLFSSIVAGFLKNVANSLLPSWLNTLVQHHLVFHLLLMPPKEVSFDAIAISKLLSHYNPSERPDLKVNSLVFLLRRSKSLPNLLLSLFITFMANWITWISPLLSNSLCQLYWLWQCFYCCLPWHNQILQRVIHCHLVADVHYFDSSNTCLSCMYSRFAVDTISRCRWTEVATKACNSDEI